MTIGTGFERTLKWLEGSGGWSIRECAKNSLGMEVSESECHDLGGLLCAGGQGCGRERQE